MLRTLRLPLLASLLAFGALTSCNKDDSDGLMVIAHDESVYMRNMHEGMAMMEAMPKTGDPDNDYSTMMIMHHQIAIKNSQEELKSGKSAEMKAMAQSIIDKQLAEITQFNAFLAGHPAHAPAVPEFNALQMMNMMQMMKAVDLRPLTGDPDFDFAQLMIDHHQAAVENSDALLKYGRENATKTLAQQIITDQKMEIKMLQDFLLANKKY
ncbi:Uncharacterized conserved protein, DUF305 family [Hymenobacter psychrophilus]|uniref:Uncharacterized conserved protein, DUF305 family n=1 Tax=Hymenobacter psychrophilus TaxID=651662 RepID=A0A1H3N716_9BACT|nr:Uncharacterized conserved protein, DUF305 family [Hymenobacter psychrophilus]